MEGDSSFLGCPCGVVQGLKLMKDKLNAEVIEQVNDTQELVLLNNFAKDSNEYQFKKCLRERITDISSWQWVLDDLNKRLAEAIDTMLHEHNALKVVINRVIEEINVRCEKASLPGALLPMCDGVEEAIMQECEFLREELAKFKNLFLVLENQLDELDKIRNKIIGNVLDKKKAITIEESCSQININSIPPHSRKRDKKTESPVAVWEQRCASLKKAGLEALASTVSTRQQVRAARVNLSIAAQAHSMRVDAVLRRRLHVNQVKLQDLHWEKDETLRDYNALTDELTATEENICETMEQERLVNARLLDRSLRPAGEMTTDEVDSRLRDELGRLKKFLRQLRNNHCRITNLQTHLQDCMVRIDNCISDITCIIRLDEERIMKRHDGIPPPCNSTDEYVGNCVNDNEFKAEDHIQLNIPERPTNRREDLQTISEDDEVDDYPFDD